MRVPVVCAVSGGVDSAVSLLKLLRSPNHHVTTALFMRNWDTREELSANDRCSSDVDLAYAQQICDKLSVALHVADFSKDYWNEVFSIMISKYKSGLTPNPDILCNRFIKFGSLRNYVDLFFGSDHFIATGHYATCQKLRNGLAQMTIPEDRVKDQTYFLSQIKQEALQQAIFPLHSVLKSRVKRIAEENGLGFVNNKKESMGICFVGERNFKSFLKDYIPPKKGKIIDFDTGKVVGDHKGVQFYTIGEQIDLPYVSKNRVRVFVCSRDSNENIVYTVYGRSNPKLWQSAMELRNFNWISGSFDTALSKQKKATNQNGKLCFSCQGRIQHSFPLVNCDVEVDKNCEELLKVRMHARVWAATPGQYAALYSNDVCLGSGEIVSVGVD